MDRQRLLRLILDLVYPPRCVGCGRRGEWICHACRVNLPRLPSDHCSVCARPGIGQAVCGECAHDPPDFERLICAFLFEGTIRQAIHQLKYRGARHLAGPLARILLDEIGPIGVPDLVIPIPLHPTRLARRGYNQSALLSAAIGRSIGARVGIDGLRRIRDTPAQVSLPGPQRRLNVRGAFEARPEMVRGRSVLLLDDVATTGSTLRAAAYELKRAGAAHVDAIVLARAP